MKIIRNGNEYDLTLSEMREIYNEMKLEYLKDDILCKADEMGMELDNDVISSIVNKVEKCLSNNDSYWESYWMSIEYAIDEMTKGN